MLNKTATWNDMKFQRSRIVCNAQMLKDTRDPAKHVTQGITEEVKKQAEQRISGRFIMCVPGVHVTIENIPKGVDAVENLQNRKNSKRAKSLLGFRAEAQLRNHRGGPLQ